MRKKNLYGAAALLVIGIIFGAVLVSGFGWVRPSLAEFKLGAQEAPVTDIDINAFSKAFVEVADKVTPSIVQINVVAERKNQQDDFFFFFPFRDNVPREQMGAGSGVIVSEDGYIITNNHVVENASSVKVHFYDKRVLEATVIGTDPLTDLAVIKVEANDLPAAYMGNSDDLKVGQWVMAIGNPLSLSSTVTAGIISAKGRSINILRDRGPAAIEDFIQTDAAINPGNSGGALVDLSGAVIGINTAIATQGSGSYIGYGFAIPINIAKTVSKELITSGKVNRGYIGVQITPVDPTTAKAVGLEKAKGVLVQNIVENGAAKDAGIKEGDIILKIDGREVNQANELQSYIASKTAGTKVNLTLWRDGETFDKSVTLKANEQDNAQPVKELRSNKSGKGKGNSLTYDGIGFTVRDMSSEEKESYKVNDGVFITEVKSLSEAYDQGLFQGLVITQADRKNVRSVDDFDEIIKNNKGKAVLLKVIDREGTARFVGIDIPS